MRFMISAIASRIAIDIDPAEATTVRAARIRDVLTEMLGRPHKADVFEHIVAIPADTNVDVDHALVLFDGRAAGVVVPERYRTEAKLCLRFGLALTPPVEDLSYDHEGVEATLMFGGERARCVVPWAAVYSIGSGLTGAGVTWPEDAPPEVRAEAEAAASAGAAAPTTQPERTPERHLKLVD